MKPTTEKESPPAFIFEGFEPANTTPVPDVLFDVLLSELSESELKVLLYIIRRTAGFKKQTDAISLTQFQKGIKKRATGEILDKGCGVKDRATIIKALASLERKGCIESTKAHDPQGDAATSSYRIRFRTASNGVVGKTNHPTDIGSRQNQPPWFAKPTTGSGQNQPGVVGDSNPQETVIQPNSEQETERQEEGTFPRESELPTSGAPAPTPALEPLTPEELVLPTYRALNAKKTSLTFEDLVNGQASQQDSYSHPNGQATQGEHNGLDTVDDHDTLPHSDMGSAVGRTRTDTRSAQGNQGQAPSQIAVAPNAATPDRGYEKDGKSTGGRADAQQLSTLSASSAQGSGKVSARTERRGKGNGKQQTYTVYWSFEASQVRDWYQEVTGMVLDNTAPNAAACHHLSKKNGMDYDTLKAVQALIDADEWLSNHNQAVGPQELADDNGKWRWERWVQVVRRNQKKLAKSMAPTSSFDAEVEASRAAMREIAAREKARAMP